MKIDSINNSAPAFCATLVTKTPVLRYYPAAKIYKPFAADVIKFDKTNKGDLDTVKRICEHADFESYGAYLLKLWDNDKWNPPIVKSNNVYAITAPQRNYDEVDINNVLGIAEFVENKDEIPNYYNQIMFLITKKPYQSKNRTRTSEYAKIGEGMTDAIKQMFSNKAIYVFADEDATQFWPKQGFKSIDSRRFIYYG